MKIQATYTVLIYTFNGTGKIYCIFCKLVLPDFIFTPDFLAAILDILCSKKNILMIHFTVHVTHVTCIISCCNEKECCKNHHEYELSDDLLLAQARQPRDWQIQWNIEGPLPTGDCSQLPLETTLGCQIAMHIRIFISTDLAGLYRYSVIWVYTAIGFCGPVVLYPVIWVYMLNYKKDDHNIGAW